MGIMGVMAERCRSIRFRELVLDFEAAKSHPPEWRTPELRIKSGRQFGRNTLINDSWDIKKY